MEPKDPGWYWCTWKMTKARVIVRTLVLFYEMQAELDGNWLALCNFTDWSERLIDPQGPEESKE